MLGHGGSSAGSYLADPTSPIPSHCAVIILFQWLTEYTDTGNIPICQRNFLDGFAINILENKTHFDNSFEYLCIVCLIIDI